MGNTLVTGGAGFIGSHLVASLLEAGEEVVVLDDFNDYYPPALKHANIASLHSHRNFRLVTGDIRDPDAVAAAFFGGAPVTRVVHLAARAGVQPSLQDPVLYADVNVTGTAVILEACTRAGVDQVVFGSSSSVYGINGKIPFSESDPVELPVSPYAATKRANELQMATFHHLTGVPVTCLRFFTVYGPRQRPDMAIQKFTRAILEGREIGIFGVDTRRDFTFVADIVKGIRAALDNPQPFLICNLGFGRAVSVVQLIETLEDLLGRPAMQVRRPLPAGDVPATWADISVASAVLGWRPETPLATGLEAFVNWLTGVGMRGAVSR